MLFQAVNKEKYTLCIVHRLAHSNTHAKNYSLTKFKQLTLKTTTLHPLKRRATKYNYYYIWTHKQLSLKFQSAENSDTEGVPNSASMSVRKKDCDQRCIQVLIELFHDRNQCFGNYLSRVMRKPTMCICENKDADQLRS